jgi:hypothetical protein
VSVTRDSLLAWLRDRTPAPPPALGSQLAACVARAPDAAFAGDSMAQVTGNLGVATLQAVSRRQDAERDAALDLLAADAFVTYAFEAASEEGSDVTALVRRLLAELG